MRLIAPEGTFSYYHPSHVFTGFAWDAQTASLLLHDRPPRSVLLLGLGGGTVARQCRTVFPEVRLVGVEVDREVLRAAVAHFHLREWKVQANCLPAETFLTRSSSQFDAILDDIWPSRPGTRKPLLAVNDWLPMVRSRMVRDGVYAVTVYGRGDEPHDFRCAVKKLKMHFRSVCEVRPALGQVTVLAATDGLIKASAKLRALGVPWSTSCGRMSLRYRIC